MDPVGQIEQHLEKLMTFYHVVGQGSIRRYALQVRLSQPTVSQALSKLESFLGQKLFERTRDGVALTPAGKIVYELASDLRGRILEGEARLGSLAGKPRHVRFGTYDSIAVYLIPSLFAELRHARVNVDCELVCASSAEIVKGLATESLDCGLVVNTEESPKHTVNLVYSDHYSFFSPTGESHATLIFVEHATDRRGKTIADSLVERKWNSTKSLIAPSFEVARALTKAGLGVGILPTRIVRDDLQRDLLKPCIDPHRAFEPFGEHDIGFVQQKRTADEPEMKAIVAAIGRVIGSR